MDRDEFMGVVLSWVALAAPLAAPCLAEHLGPVRMNLQRPIDERSLTQSFEYASCSVGDERL